MKRVPILVIGLVLVALALRLWHLTFQSLWWDEGVSVYLSGAGVGALTASKDFAVDLHPPGYYLLLSAWRVLFGPSVLADRLLSAFAGVLTIPLVVVLARWVTGPHPPAPSPSEMERGRTPGVALFAGLLAAVSPIDVYYSQEARMYPLLPVVGALSLLATVRVLDRGKRRDWAGWAAANLASWYVYYYLGLLTAAEALVMLVVAARRGQLRAWLLAQVGVVVGFAPWLAIAARRMGGQSLALPPETTIHPTPWQYLVENWEAFTLGFSLPPAATLLLLVWAAVTLIGAVVLARRRPAALALLVASLAIPLLGAGGVLLARPFFYPRFILFVLVPLWLLAAVGIGTRWRLWPLGAVALVALVAGSGWTYRYDRTTPRTAYSTSDYLTVFSTIAGAARPGDVVLCGYPWQAGYVTAYLSADGVRPVYAPGPLDRERLTTSAAPGGRAWLFDYGPGGQFDDDLGRLERSGAHALVLDQFGDSRVALFSYDPSANPRILPLATLGDEVALTGAGLPPSTVLHPGDHAAITLDWQALAAPRANYTVFVHLLDPSGKVQGQSDSPPLKGGAPTGGWVPGEELVDRYDLILAPGAPPGRYLVEVGMYRPENGQRLKVGPTPQPNDRIVVGALSVAR